MVPRSSVMGPTRKKRTLPCGRAPFVPAKYAVNACAGAEGPFRAVQAHNLAGYAMRGNAHFGMHAL